ncbi:zf-HC2 domain-containing protein [Vibrio gazogenes]|nr:zf-HC2 domain-containing protein [Vibrio gazogenes]
MMMNCKQATRLLSERMERTLTTKEKLALRLHTSMCSSCRRFGNQMDDIRLLSKRYMSAELKDKEE